MKKISISLILAGGLIFITSCENGKKVDVEALQRENDSLMLVNAQTQADYDEVIQLINEIQIGFAEIKSAENYIIVNKNNADDIDKSVREKIADDMTLISNTLKENRAKIDKLQAQLRENKNLSAQLKETINTLNQSIEEKTQMIADLQAELAKRDIRIAELDNAVTTLTAMNNTQTDVIAQQEDQLNTVYYAFGTSKELRDQRIIESRGRNLLKGDYNKNYFTKADIRNLNKISLGAKKARLLTTHPDGSYSLDADANKTLTLNIIKPEDFWSSSRYLVIEVD